MVAGILLIAAVSAQAEIMTYVDDKGKTWYVDRLSAVPVKYQDQVKKSKNVPLFAAAGAPDAQGSETSSTAVEVFLDPEQPESRQLEQFLLSRGITYQRYDIVNNPGAKAIYDSIGLTTLPVVKIGGVVIPGFNPESILAEVERNRP